MLARRRIYGILQAITGNRKRVFMANYEKHTKLRHIFHLLGIAVATAAVLALLWVTIGILAGEIKPNADKPKQPQAETLPPSPYAAEDFTAEDGFLRYHGGTAHRGIDVSSHQGQIDWQAVAGDGIEFAFVRLGYRGYADGGIFADDSFSDNVIGAHGAGIETGAYFFSQAVSVEEAVEEADYVCQALEPYDMTYPIIFDWERIEGSRSDGVDYATVAACAKAFCQRVEENGYTAGIYFNLDMAKHIDLTELQDYQFWLAEYAAYPSYAYAFDCWQYSCTGTVSGISTQTDLNLYFE